MSGGAKRLVCTEEFTSGEWLHVDLGIFCTAKLNWKTISAIAVQTYPWVNFVAS